MYLFTVKEAEIPADVFVKIEPENLDEESSQKVTGDVNNASNISNNITEEPTQSTGGNVEDQHIETRNESPLKENNITQNDRVSNNNENNVTEELSATNINEEQSLHEPGNIKTSSNQETSGDPAPESIIDEKDEIEPKHDAVTEETNVDNERKDSSDDVDNKNVGSEKSEKDDEPKLNDQEHNELKDSLDAP